MEILHENPLYDMMYLGERKSWEVKINTTIDDEELQRTINFTLKAITDGGNQQFKLVSLKIGCFKETSI